MLGPLTLVSWRNSATIRTIARGHTPAGLTAAHLAVSWRRPMSLGSGQVLGHVWPTSMQDTGHLLASVKDRLTGVTGRVLGCEEATGGGQGGGEGLGHQPGRGTAWAEAW